MVIQQSQIIFFKLYTNAENISHIIIAHLNNHIHKCWASNFNFLIK